MKVFNIALFLLFLLTMTLQGQGQENSTVPKRTPEQEAAKQTEKLQQELNLNQDQAKQVYEINLRYARDRQISNKRSEAMERMKNKNADIQRVLSPEQNDRLQSKRYERTYFETTIPSSNQSVNSSNFRSSTNFRTNRPVRAPNSSNASKRNSYRPVNPNFHPGGQQNQPTRGTTTAPSSTRPNTGSSTFSPDRRETTTPMHNPSPENRTPTRSNYAPARTDPPANTNRK